MKNNKISKEEKKFSFSFDDEILFMPKILPTSFNSVVIRI